MGVAGGGDAVESPPQGGQKEPAAREEGGEGSRGRSSGAQSHTGTGESDLQLCVMGGNFIFTLSYVQYDTVIYVWAPRRCADERFLYMSFEFGKSFFVT